MLLIAEEVGRHKTFPLPNMNPELIGEDHTSSYASTCKGLLLSFLSS